MSLLEGIFGKKKVEVAPQPVQPSTQEVTGEMRDLDQEIANDHRALELQTAAATNQAVVPGSSIPAANTIPGSIAPHYETDPMKVLIPQPEAQQNLQQRIEESLPKSFQSTEVNSAVQTGLGVLGEEHKKDAISMVDQIFNGRSHRTTEGNRFLQEIEEKKKLGNPLADLKKAA